MTTYQNLILRRKGQQNYPVMIGPVALVKDKTALVSEEPSLSQLLKGCGLDGEINLEKMLDSTFQQAYRFRLDVPIIFSMTYKTKQDR